MRMTNDLASSLTLRHAEGHGVMKCLSTNPVEFNTHFHSTTSGVLASIHSLRILVCSRSSCSLIISSIPNQNMSLYSEATHRKETTASRMRKRYTLP